MANLTERRPKLYTYKGNPEKEWFVGFNVGGKRFQVRMGINSIKDPKAKIRYGKDVIKIVENALSEGWDPRAQSINDFIEKNTDSRLDTDINHQTFAEALDFALDKGEWAKKTRLGFKCTANYFKDAGDKLCFCDLPIIEITKQHILQMSSQAKKDLNWSNASYNKYINYISVILSVLVNWDIIPHNPAHDIKRLPTVETNKYEPFTVAEKKKLHENLSRDHYLFYVYFMVIYHTGARPKEVLALKIGNIRFDLQEIHILPDLEEENSKTKKIRRIPINPHLLYLLQSLGLDKYPNEYYVFGSPNKQGRGNSGKGVLHPDYFRPSKTRIKRDTVTKFWKEVVWKGLGIHKYLYAAKHTGGDDKILAGVDLDALRELYGHSSKQMTEHYVSRLREVHKKKIIENSPDFL